MESFKQDVSFLNRVSLLMTSDWWKEFPDDIKEYIFKYIVPRYFRRQQLYYLEKETKKGNDFNSGYYKCSWSHWKKLWDKALILSEAGYSRLNEYRYFYKIQQLIMDEVKTWEDPNVRVYREY